MEYLKLFSGVLAIPQKGTCGSNSIQTAFGIQQNLDKYVGQKSLSQSPSELTINYS